MVAEVDKLCDTVRFTSLEFRITEIMKRTCPSKASKSSALRRHAVCFSKPVSDVPELKPNMVDARRPKKERDSSRSKPDKIS